VLTYLGERQKVAISELSQDFDIAALIPCDVTKDEEMAALAASLLALGRPLHAVVHSLAFANREDLERPFTETSREGFPAGAERERVFAGGRGAGGGAGDDRGWIDQHFDLPGVHARGAEL